MKIIDIHRHLWDYEWFPPGQLEYNATTAAYRRWPPRDPAEVLPRTRLGGGSYDPDGSKMLADMEELGIDRSVVMVLDWGMAWKVKDGRDSPLPIDKINQHVLSLAEKFPDRVNAFCSFDPRRKESLKWFEVAVREWGAKGLKVYPPCGFYADDAIMMPFYMKAIEMDVPVLIHCGGSGMNLLSKYSGAEPIGRVARLLPDLKIIVGHTNLQGRFESKNYWQGIAVGGASRNVWLDITDWQVTGALEERNIATFWRVLDHMRNSVGAHRILWGTDMPMRGPGFELTRRWVQMFKGLPEEGAKFGLTFTQEETEKICHRNAEQLLKIVA